MTRNNTSYNTNLSAEFWVLSALHRMGMDAQLTLGNKKSVDILVNISPKTVCTIDVKGLADSYDWPADNICIFDNPNHFYILLTFEGKISDLQVSPAVWIIPSNEIQQFIKQYRTRKVLSRSLIKSNASRFKNAWNYFSPRS
jgi:hypothetical protein